MQGSARVALRAIAGLGFALATMTLVGAASIAGAADLPTSATDAVVTDATEVTDAAGSDVDSQLPGTTDDVADKVDETTKVTTGIHPDIPDLGAGTIDPNGIIGGDTTDEDGGEPSPEPTTSSDPTPDPDTDTDTAGGGAAGSSRGGRDDGVGDVTPAAARVPAPSSNAIDRAMRLARPFAPAVVIAALGLLALAGAARGNDRLVKHEEDGTSNAGAWRL